METLSTTEPHYIRCVKPNTVLKPGIFENDNVLNQLRCGVCIFPFMFCAPLNLIENFIVFMAHGAGCFGSNPDQLCWLSDEENI